MKCLAYILFLVPSLLFGATESVSIDTKTKKVQNPLVKFGIGNTLDGTGATITGFPGSSYTFADSLLNVAGTVTLVNDSASPGDSKYYGTDSGGTLGYFDITGGSSVSISATLPIIVTPNPITGTGVISLATPTPTSTFTPTATPTPTATATATATATPSATATATPTATACSECLQWDGGATNLVSGTGRTSLGLGTLATQNGTFSGTSSGTNTGDQTSVSGNAGTATALQNARTIGGVSFDGTGNIVPQTIQSVNEATDTTCFPLFISASGSQSLQPLNNASLTFNSNTGAFGATSFSGAGTGLTGTASSLTSGNVTTNANLTGVVTSSGNATTLGSFSSANLRTALTDENGTGVALFDSSTSATFITPALGTPASGVMTNVTGTANGLTAGDVTRNHALYEGASPPTVDVGQFTVYKASIDLKTAGTTTIFTVPTSRTFIATQGMVIVTAVTNGGAGTENLTIKESSAARTMLTALVVNSATPVANQSIYAIIDASVSAVLSNCTAGNSVQVVVTTSHAGSTAVSGTVYVTGFYTQSLEGLAIAILSMMFVGTLRRRK